ncbi:hypothetical protein PMM47T1_19873 [Pseudomonas sp. M47T1]|uniref:hypothetical protein n=1 Tax=Pseudomonas sp. M47T1 TaxID=1179778 RepID=UPI00026072D3|nr:hypothetical protein [Pseudomonas sp. M47T1]EIK94789.1 hypothetical protein PMM47T1_19873 [Pseudomonas sp. M47T1]
MSKRYQANPVREARVWLAALVLLLAVLLCGGAVALLLGYLRDEAARQQPVLGSLERERLLPPEPRLQATPFADGEAFRARALQQRDSYGWVDRDQGIVRVPLAEAQRLLIERGWPDAH